MLLYKRKLHYIVLQIKSYEHRTNNTEILSFKDCDTDKNDDRCGLDFQRFHSVASVYVQHMRSALKRSLNFTYLTFFFFLLSLTSEDVRVCSGWRTFFCCVKYLHHVTLYAFICLCFVAV